MEPPDPQGSLRLGSHGSSGNTDDRRIRLHILGDERAGADRRSVTDVQVLKDRCSGSNEAPAPDSDAPGEIDAGVEHAVVLNLDICPYVQLRLK